MRKKLRTCRDGYIVYSDDPYRTEHIMIDDFLQNVSTHLGDKAETALRTHPSGIAILESDPNSQIRYIIAATHRTTYTDLTQRYGYVWRQASAAVRNTLLRRALPFSRLDLVELLDLLEANQYALYDFPTGLLFKGIETFLQSHGNDADILQRVIRFRESNPYIHGSLKSKIDRLLGNHEIRLNRGDSWGKATADFLESLDPEQHRLWYELIQLASQQETASSPTRKFLAAAKGLIDRIGRDSYIEQLTHLIKVAGELRPEVREITTSHGMDYIDVSLLADAMNETILRSLVWTVPEVCTAELLHSLGDLALQSFAMAQGKPAALRLGNGCTTALAMMEGLEGMATLVQLRYRVRHKAVLRRIEQLIADAAKRAGTTQYEIEDLAVPAFELRDGMLRKELGEWFAELTITDGNKAQILWRQKGGKQQKSVPAEIKQKHSEKLQELKRTAKEIEKMLPAQRDRLDNFYLDDRNFSFDYWLKNFLHQDLMSIPTRKLIWNFEVEGKEISVIWENNRLVDAAGNPAPQIPPEAQGKLWHPLNASVEEVIAWRNYIEERQIRQPFKQAYREVYILTDAELNTETYSNRFAAHIVRQHQLNALARGRNWSYRLLGAFDEGQNDGRGQRPLRAWGITAEFRVDEIWNDEGMAPSGIWLYVSTDYVRFIRNGDPMRLADVPPIVFSEIMRDADLFVGVASIGNDPNWEDHGTQQYNGYWHSYSFGPLTTSSAQVRREGLEKMLPRLSIAPRCSIRNQFLVVRGDLRTYKIHLGSGNILMEPNDQYLCIVPDGSKRIANTKIFLPFEEDGMFSLILSKAFLLAEDTKITDPTIMRQITYTE